MKRVKSVIVVIFTLILFIFPAGCAKKNSDTNKSPAPTKSPEQNVYENREIGYKITIPEGWKTPEGVSVGELYIEYQNVTFEPKPSFNIISTKVDRYDLRDKKKQKEIKDEIDKNLKVASERTVNIDGQTAYQIVYGVEKDKESLLIFQTYLFNKGFLMVLTAGCREDKFTNFLPEFKNLIQSLKLT